MIVPNNTCEGSDLSHRYYICMQLNSQVDGLEWCHHYLEWCHQYQKVEQYGDMTACHLIQDSIIQSFMHAIIQSFNDSIIWSFNYAAFDCSTVQSFNDSRIGSLDHWIFQPFDRPIIWLFNHLIVHALDRSIIRSLDPLETDYTRLTKADRETDYSRMTMVHHITCIEKIDHLVKELLLSMIGIWISFDYLIIRLFDHSIILSADHLILIIRFSIVLHSIVRSFNHSITGSFNHSIIWRLTIADYNWLWQNERLALAD